ncbi:hypothetical protein Aperf_G00000001015 [Anoplocephala perfoliata]
MHPGFIWIFIMIGQLSPIVSSANPIGILEVQIHYQNIAGVVPDGRNCDSFAFNRLCDIFFEICLTEEGNPRPCNVFFQKTDPVRNTISVHKILRINYYTNRKLNLKIKALDHDRFSAPDELGEFLYSFIPKSVSPGQRLMEIQRRGAHPSSEMTLTVTRICANNHFGDECCSVPEDRGHCDSDGNPSCYPGYFGPGCTLVDTCLNSTCASFAICQPMGGSFICLCDNTLGERCEEGYDPCREHICEHDGVCVPTGENKNFAKCINCSLGWEGLHCEKKLPTCEMETLKLGHPPCVNGGHCNVSPTNDSIFTCLCAPGWQGDRCEISFTKASATVAAISMCILILVTCCIVAIICYCRVYVLRKSKDIELTPVESKTIGELSRANNIYEITQDQMESQDVPHKAFMRQINKLVRAKPQTCPFDDDDYETTLDQRQSHSSSAAQELAKEEEEYEPVSYKVRKSLGSEARSTSNYAYGLSTDASEPKKRLLPSLPLEGDEYEYLCNCDPDKDQIC